MLCTHKKTGIRRFPHIYLYSCIYKRRACSENVFSRDSFGWYNEVDVKYKVGDVTSVIVLKKMQMIHFKLSPNWMSNILLYCLYCMLMSPLVLDKAFQFTQCLRDQEVPTITSFDFNLSLKHLKRIYLKERDWINRLDNVIPVYCCRQVSSLHVQNEN